ncbi:MAG: hypothetical protein IPP17_17265 [Bacteroidetes bacterium]|nr:hypothetical protein [Bacteroidota bacterium]
MKIFLYTILFVLLFSFGNVSAQTTAPSSESFGNTLNLGVGIGYYGYVGRAMPALSANYEFNVARNFTLAPFVTFITYRNYRRWDGYNYAYRQSVVPMGLKGTYYFDRLLHAGSRWDFYLAGSLGFALRTTRWETGYYGDPVVERGTSGLYLDGHIGAEYHASQNLGLFLDLSTGISLFGLAIHL